MKIGLVLSGGGALGAYQIGVFKALKKLNIDKHINVISGTSIGALNAILFMQDDLDKAEKIWYDLSMEKVLPTDNFDLFKKGIKISLGAKKLSFIKKYMPRSLEDGNVSRDGLLDVIDKHLDINKIINSKIECYATCTEVEELKAKYFKYNDYKEEDIRKIILATSAIPSVYEAEEIDGKKYLDGGMVDNTPIQPVYGAGCDLIIISYLSKEDSINRENYPNTNIIELKPLESNQGIMNGLLDFNNKSIKKRISKGYEDTLNLIEPIILLSNEIQSEKDKKYSFLDGIKNSFKNFIDKEEKTS
ncbi:MAG: patatin-like phospholipase family protein [Sarcina sp.]